jgi:serine/threonine protein kinase
MTNPHASPTDPGLYAERTQAALGNRYRLDHMVAASRERVLFNAYDLTLKRRISLRVNLYPDSVGRSWFLREAEALAQLDHPAIRHVYDAGVIGDLAFRAGSWIDGESALDAVQRGPRPIPTVHALARDILTALDHAHSRGIIVRRIVPASLLLGPTGRGTVTDLRYCSYTLPDIPAGHRATGLNFMAPEIRDGARGDPSSDVFTAGAILYYAITGREPPADPSDTERPSSIRPTCPKALDRILLRALRPAADDRYLTPAEMLEDFASDAGTYESPIVSPGENAPQQDTEHWEKRLRRALGDDYELFEALGAGGFGRVYRVRDLHLEREAALKVLHPYLTAEPTVVERFRREAQLAARLHHPNIVDIYDISGRAGLLWYTMEYVKGPNLAQLVDREGPLPLELVLQMLHQALLALAHAHGAGLVHRDIKPENLLVAPDGTLRITDFGLALALRGEGKFGGATSQSGTPQFASPEQLLGERVDQRSDFYSLAAVAYFILLGETPFPGGTPEQILARQTADRFPALHARRADVPDALESVLQRAMRNEVEARYPSAAEFLQALQRAMGRKVRERSGEWARAAARWWRGGGSTGPT